MCYVADSKSAALEFGLQIRISIHLAPAGLRDRPFGFPNSNASSIGFATNRPFGFPNPNVSSIGFVIRLQPTQARRPKFPILAALLFNQILHHGECYFSCAEGSE